MPTILLLTKRYTGIDWVLVLFLDFLHGLLDRPAYQTHGLHNTLLAGKGCEYTLANFPQHGLLPLLIYMDQLTCRGERTDLE